MNYLANKIKAKDLKDGAELTISGDGWNENITASAGLVDGKTVFFLTTYTLDGEGENPEMESTETFASLAALKRAV